MLRDFLSMVRKRVPVMVRDGVGLAGFASIVCGVWMIYPPAAFIIGGVCMVTAAVLSARASA